MTSPDIHIFTRPDCPHCAAAKDALEQAGLAYAQIDVTASDRNREASIFASGAGSVPQVFAGARLIGDGATVVNLAASGRLKDAAARPAPPLDLSMIDDDVLAKGAEDLPMRDRIPEIDPLASDDPETWGILHHFAETFGFLPNSAYYQIRWPEAYKLYSYSHYFDTEREGAETLGMEPMLAASWATSDAHGCDYCRVHTTNMGGNEGGIARAVRAARGGRFDADGPIGPFELALADLAGAATTNTVDDALLARVRETHAQARITQADAQANIEAVATIAAAFGFLNVFNDIVDIPIEREWAAASSENAGIEAGRHGTSDDRASDNLDGALPEGGRSAEDMIAKYERVVAVDGGVEGFCRRAFGTLPGWIAAWPDAMQARHALFYDTVMGEHVHSVLPAELKHLMARVSAIARGHDGLATEAGAMALRAGSTPDRVAGCWEAALARTGGRTDLHDLFDDRDRALLGLARLSTTMPLTTPRRYIGPAYELLTPRELIEASFVVALASMVQRYTAVMRPQTSRKATESLANHGIECDTLRIRAGLA